jgi:hypothetical protein
MFEVSADILAESYESDHVGRHRLVETLYNRRVLIRDLIAVFRTSSRAPFPNWTEN